MSEVVHRALPKRLYAITRAPSAASAWLLCTCDGGGHRRKDRPNGGLYVSPAHAMHTLSCNVQYVVVCQVFKSGKEVRE